MKSFDAWHPIGLFLYFTIILSVVMFTNHPLMMILSFSGGLFYYIITENKKPFFRNAWVYLLFLTLITLTNPFFSKEGVTVLFFVNDRAVTREALLYGMNMGVMIISVLIWFKNYIRIVDPEKFMYLFGRIFPGIALLISMSLGFIPVFIRRAKIVLQAQQTMGLYDAGGYLMKVRTALRVFSVVMTWSLEAAVETADSMKARGYGMKKRTHFSIFRFRAADAGLMLITTILFSAVVWGIASGKTYFEFYPRIVYADTGPVSVLCFAAYAVLVFIPGLIEIKEMIRWKYYLSKI